MPSICAARGDMAAAWPPPWILAGLFLLSTLGCKDSTGPLQPAPAWTWQELAFAADARCVAIGAAGTLFVGAADGAYRSNDGGETFHFLSSGWSLRQPRVVTDLAVGAGGTVACATPAGVYVSQDRGDTWSLSRLTASGGDTLGIETIAIAPNGVLFAGMAAQGGGVFRSSDHGLTWEQRVLIQNTSSYGIGYITASQRDLVFFGTWFNRDFRSTDQGETWLPFVLVQGTQFNVPYTTDLVADALGALVACNHEALFRSLDDGASWGRMERGHAYTALAAGAPGEVFAAADAGQIFHSTDGGRTWKALGESIDLLVQCMATGPGGELYVAAVQPERRFSRLLRGRRP